MKIILNNLFCFHKNWSKVDERGYQYCGLCGIAIQAPPPPSPPECPHLKKEVSEIIKASNKLTGSLIKITYVQRCMDCGTLSNHEVIPGSGLFTTAETQ